MDRTEFEIDSQAVEAGRVVRFSVTQGGKPLTFGNVIDLWQESEAFCREFVRTLQESAFGAFRWETPGLTSETLAHPFEFVLLDAPGFETRTPDAAAFAEHFHKEDAWGIVRFENLGRDATLIVPSPRGESRWYGHLADFVRYAPAGQVLALWRVVGEAVAARVGEKPVWLSTAGGGVAWLHVRLDDRPKYYAFGAYRVVGGGS